MLLGGLLSARPGAAQQAPMPVYVTPFYDSEGPVVRVGPFSRELAAATPATIEAVVTALRQRQATLPALTMYVAAVRLYDLGRRDEAVYWFYCAQYRARLFQGALDEQRVGGLGAPAFELRAAHNAFNQLAGEYINGYAGCDPPRWRATVLRVQQENQRAVPPLATIYPQIAFQAPAEWAARNADVNQGLSKLAGFIQENTASMRTARAQNGANKRFCGK